MTEAEWLACDDPQKMLAFLHGKASDRKLRLFACGCCRRIWNLLSDKRSCSAVEVAERLADGLADSEAQGMAKMEAQAACRDAAISHSYHTPPIHAARAAYHAVTSSERAIHYVAVATAEAVKYMGMAIPSNDPFPHVPVFPSTTEPSEQCQLLRDILDNCFRKIDLEAALLTPTVCAMARSIYDGRRFEDLPILADALEDAGCDNVDILAHCRNGGEHVRGCWVVDLILRKA